MKNLKTNRLYLLTFIFSCITLFLVFFSGAPSIAKSRFFTVSSEYATTEKYPGSFLHDYQPNPLNTSYCYSNYGFPKDLKFYRNDLEYGPELGEKNSYRILYNVIEAKLESDVPGITYATHMTVEFVNYVPELLRYWDGLISIAAFVTDPDIALVLEQLNRYCNCLPEMSRVSVHLVFNEKFALSQDNLNFSKPSDCIVQDFSKQHAFRNFEERVVYPINVCRNAARTGSLTKFILVSDIQLMPSKDLAGKFLEMVSLYKLSDSMKTVFVVPIFEVESSEDIPKSKKELIQLMREEKAVYFHRHVCLHCQKFPGIESWIFTDPGDAVKPLLTVKREVPYNRWEPIYIGTKNEPYYNERLSWEGLQDKMLQMLEMCLIGYKFIILDGAFLIHWPGMKKIKTRDGETWRNDFVKRNAQEYRKILSNLTIKYEPNPYCKIR